MAMDKKIPSSIFHLPTSKPPLVVIVGETASGKSSLGLELAKKFNGEIICADSWTVRQGVNIGTAKPTTEEQVQIRHHLLDIVEPCGNFTAAVFKRLALEAITDIASRGKLAIMVGGTGLYTDGVIFDYSFLPAGSAKQRKKLNDMQLPELVSLAQSQKLDLEGIDLFNKRRIIRLIENNGQRPKKSSLRDNTLIIGIKNKPEEIKLRIADRVVQMIDDGLEAEARSLSAKFGWECEALKGIGYKEWRLNFEGSQTIDQTKDRIISATNDLAKRQRTWFKRNKSIHWIENQISAVDLATQFLNKQL